MTRPRSYNAQHGNEGKKTKQVLGQMPKFKEEEILRTTNDILTGRSSGVGSVNQQQPTAKFLSQYRKKDENKTGRSLGRLQKSQ